jgi:uncharacterized membrane protein (UPF0127 family)
MKKFILILMSLALTAVACNQAQLEPPTNFKSGTVKLADKTLSVEIAETEALRAQGLSNRVSMPEDHGMLFIFQIPGKHTFWMKDTNFPLDFIWIKDGKITEITPNAKTEPGIADDKLTRYTPQNDVDSVLEVNGGWTGRNQLRVGDSVVALNSD